MRKNNRGFSLVELIIVIAIMAILAGAIAPAILKYIEKSRQAAYVQKAETFQTALETVAIDVATDTGYDLAYIKYNVNGDCQVFAVYKTSGDTNNLQCVDLSTIVGTTKRNEYYNQIFETAQQDKKTFGGQGYGAYVFFDKDGKVNPTCSLNGKNIGGQGNQVTKISFRNPKKNTQVKAYLTFGTDGWEYHKGN